jgi:hypothetical protein
LRKQKPIPEPTEELKAKCDAENQLSNLDRLFRSVIAAPKADVLKAEAEEKQKKARKKKRT